MSNKTLNKYLIFYGILVVYLPKLTILLWPLKQIKYTKNCATGIRNCYYGNKIFIWYKCGVNVFQS